MPRDPEKPRGELVMFPPSRSVRADSPGGYCLRCRRNVTVGEMRRVESEDPESAFSWYEVHANCGGDVDAPHFDLPPFNVH